DAVVPGPLPGQSFLGTLRCAPIVLWSRRGLVSSRRAARGEPPISRKDSISGGVESAAGSIKCCDPAANPLDGPIGLIHYTRAVSRTSMERPMKRIAAVAALLASALAATAALAQYPAKPVRLVAPFAPGGGSDFIARLIAQKLSERFGQQVVVENKPGAGGNLGAELVVRSAADGYTILLTPASYTVNPALYKLAFDPIAEITPIIQLSQGPFVVAVHPSVPATTLKELVAVAAKSPDKLSYASSGNGSIVHLATEYFLDLAKVRMVHVPYKGSGPALNDTVAGNVQVVFGTVATALQYVRSG